MTPYVVGVTGASAQPLAERTLELLLLKGESVHLILSKGAYKVWQAEMNINVPIDPSKQEVFWRNRLNVLTGKLFCHRWDDLSASISSGSYKTKGMLIIPCTMGTVGRIASGFSLSLIERCADVHIKESRKLVISPREMPLSLIHLRNLATLSKSGVKIVPPVPAWYTKPISLEEMIDFIVIRTFDCFEENLAPLQRWSKD